MPKMGSDVLSGLRNGGNRRLGERVPAQHASNLGPPSDRRLNEHTLHGRPQPKWSQEVAGRVAAPGGPRGDRALVFARCLRIASTTSCSVMKAMTFISEPHDGHSSGSTS